MQRDLVTRRSRSLPHWEHPEGIYFITFRLADSVPEEVVKAYKEEQESLRAQWIKAGEEERTDLEREMARLYCRRIDKCLDVGIGGCYLADSASAAIVAQSLKHFDRERYDLFAWSILPKHVHAVVRPLGEIRLPQILHSWKSYSATKVNARHNRRGTLWQREYFDHLIRSQSDLDRFVRYVDRNPGRAGLHDSPWHWVCEELTTPSAE